MRYCAECKLYQRSIGGNTLNATTQKYQAAR